MKKADIEKAVQSHCDSVAIFHSKDGGYYRLATSEEQQIERQQRPGWEHHNTKQKVLLVGIEEIDESGVVTSRYVTSPTAGFRDAHYYSGDLAISWQPLSRIIECVNATKTFVDYIAERDAKDAARRARLDALHAEQNRENKRRETLRDDLSRRITKMLGEQGMMLWVDSEGDVEINIDLLAALVERAEKAGA